MISKTANLLRRATGSDSGVGSDVGVSAMTNSNSGEIRLLLLDFVIVFSAHLNVSVSVPCLCIVFVLFVFVFCLLIAFIWCEFVLLSVFPRIVRVLAHSIWICLSHAANTESYLQNAQQFLQYFYLFLLFAFTTISYFALAETIWTANGFQLNASSLRRRLLYASWQRRWLLSVNRIPQRPMERKSAIGRATQQECESKCKSKSKSKERERANEWVES